MDIIVESKTSLSAFFIINSSVNYNTLLGRDWINVNWCVLSSIHQCLLLWKGNEIEFVWTNIQSFIANSNAIEASYYNQEFGINIARNRRKELRSYLEDPNRRILHKVIIQAQKFALLGELYRKGIVALLLKCLSFPDSKEVMKQVHEGVYRAHQYEVNIRWLIRRHDYF